MFEEIVRLSGKKRGLASMVLVGVHGDERCGVEALGKILPSLEIERGTVIFAYGNPRAIEANKRYVDFNLNRMFKGDDLLTVDERGSYEYRRAGILKEYLDEAGALLDIHSSSIPDSRAFAICEANAQEIVTFLPIKLVVSGFDQVEPGGSDYYMNSTGKVGICLECGYTKDPRAVIIAEEGILAFLRARGHLSGKKTGKSQSYVRMFMKYYAKTDNFTLSKSFENFERLEDGEVIGIDGREKIRAPKRSLILFANNGTKIGDEVFLLGEEKESLV